MKKSWIAAFVASLAAAPAAAQPGGWTPPADDPRGDATADPLADQPPPITPPSEPEPPATVSSEPAPPPPGPVAEAPAEPSPDRPTDLSVGIGLGYDLPADLQQPNVASVRFRLPSGLTLEPFAALALGSQTEEVGGIEASTSTFGLEVGADARLPYRVRGPVDLVLVGGAGLGTSSTNPDGDANDSSTFFLDLHWGLGLEFWFRSHWCLSLTATNPLLVYQQSNQENGVDDTTSSRFDIGAVWEPNIVAALHLFL